MKLGHYKGFLHPWHLVDWLIFREEKNTLPDKLYPVGRLPVKVQGKVLLA